MIQHIVINSLKSTVIEAFVSGFVSAAGQVVGAKVAGDLYDHMFVNKEEPEDEQPQSCFAKCEKCGQTFQLDGTGCGQSSCSNK